MVQATTIKTRHQSLGPCCRTTKIGETITYISQPMYLQRNKLLMLQHRVSIFRQKIEWEHITKKIT